MASPHVAGAAALYLSDNPSATPQQVRDALVNDATDGKVTDPGTGSPNKLRRGRSARPVWFARRADRASILLMEVQAGMATFRVRVERPASPAPVVVVDVDGPLDEAAGMQLRSLAEAAAALRPTGEVHVNLSAAQAPDLAQFLAALHDAHQAAARRGCRLLVCQPPDELRAALRESGLPLCDDADHQPG